MHSAQSGSVPGGHEHAGQQPDDDNDVAVMEDGTVGASTLHVNETFAITGEDNGTSFCIQDLSGSSEWRFTSVPKQNRVVQYLPMIQR